MVIWQRAAPASRAHEVQKLLQTYKAKDGERTNEFTLSPDGESLLLKVIVRSPKLSKVLHYSLVYSAAK